MRPQLQTSTSGLSTVLFAGERMFTYNISIRGNINSNKNDKNKISAQYSKRDKEVEP